jgi:hypothetical protein
MDPEIYSNLTLQFKEEFLDGTRIYSHFYNSDWMNEASKYCRMKFGTDESFVGYYF